VTGCFKGLRISGYDMGLVIDAKDPGHMWASLTLRAGNWACLRKIFFSCGTRSSYQTGLFSCTLRPKSNETI